MSVNSVIIIDFSNEHSSNSQLINFDQRILSFCSMITEWLLKKNLKQKVAIILNRGGTTEQISHLTGNISLHVQGLRRILVNGMYGKKNIKSSIYLARRLLSCASCLDKSEILLISSEYSLYIPLHFLGSIMLRDKIKFSVIGFNKTVFLYEILSKLTGGFYVNFDIHQKYNLFFMFKSSYLNKTQLIFPNPLTIGAKRIKFVDINFFTEKYFEYKERILRYCSICKFCVGNTSNSNCMNCGMIFAEKQIRQKIDIKDINTLKILPDFFKKFSIFSLYNNYRKYNFAKLSDKKNLPIKNNSYNLNFFHNN
nr:hypothetical protein 1634Bnrm2_p027 [Cryptomonas sp.]